MTHWDDLSAVLDDLAAAGLRRNPATLDSPVGPRVTVDGREVVCLCSNDYLALAADAAVKAAAAAAIETWGVGAGASRLICGTSELHRRLEGALANFKGVEDTVVTSTGWMANHAAISALAGDGDLVLADKLDHASILDAARTCGATCRTYAHGDVERLTQLLQRLRGKHRRCVIVTDSLFSMDGDLAPLAALVEIKQRFDARLVIDEAHATGVLGEGGRGAAELLGVEAGVDLTVGTLSKALGSMGGFVAGPAVAMDLIRNTARPYIYTTALPPAMCGAALAALQIVSDQPERRQRLLALAADLRARLAAAGLDTLASDSQIIPIVIGDAARAVEVSGGLFEAGFLVPAIRPPTVAPGTSRLRVSLSAGHEDPDVARFADAVASLV
ncbi:MAG: 8-amino-7-oxononanoate synthase [Planctomycetota bacterium]|jgi:8-amino-7-oxononanoate synthase